MLTMLTVVNRALFTKRDRLKKSKLRLKKTKLMKEELKVSFNLVVCNTFLVMKLGMGTSDHIQFGSNEYKRTDSLHHEGVKDNVIIISKDWKSKGIVSTELSPSRM